MIIAQRVVRDCQGADSVVVMIMALLVVSFALIRPSYRYDLMTFYRFVSWN